MAFSDGVKTGPIAYIGLVSVIITFVLVLLLQVVYFGQQEDMQAAGSATGAPPAELSTLRARQWTQLTERKVVDRERGVVTVGITRAMELVVKELSAGKTPAEVMGPALPNAGGAGAPGAPPAAATPAAGATGDGSAPAQTPEKHDGT